MNRLQVILFVALVLSGLYMVRVSYEARRLFVEVERAQAEERQLETEYEQLQVDKRAQATPLRVEKVAREKLAMRTATPAVTHYVTHAEAAPTAASGAASGEGGR